MWKKDWVLVWILMGLVGGSLIIAGPTGSDSDSGIILQTSKPIDSFTGSLSAQNESISAGTPAVFVIHPNGGESWRGAQTITWTAIDPQNDSLIYIVYYSPNEGNTWIQITTGLTKWHDSKEICKWGN